MKDKISVERCSLLHPKLQQRARKFFELMEERGLYPRMSQGLRTIEEQNALYAIGRTRAGQIVTNSKGGQSWHNYACAFDLVFILTGGSVDFVVSKEIGDLGASCGLEWGGNWASFSDKPHFQLPGLPSNPKLWTKGQLEQHLNALDDVGVTTVPEVKEDLVASWAEPSFIKAEKKGFSRNSVNAPLDPVRLRRCLVKAGVQITDSSDPVTYQEFVVILDRLHLL